jgi:hypothetical protein
VKFLLSLILFASFSALADVTDFKSNGCTMFPEGTRANPKQWEHCCIEHDLFFWAGGTRGERDLADLELRDCVIATGAREIGRLMYAGVRAGYRSPIRLSKEGWGNAWQGTRVGHTSLNEVETGEIIQSLELQGEVVSPCLFEKFKQVLWARLQ